jgi:hypothetical protein
MKPPFEKYDVKAAEWGHWGTFKVYIWPIAPVFSRWGKENAERNKEARQFIEDAVREKLEREAGTR